MANIKTPDGGFYVDDTEFNVDYVNNIVTLANGGGGGAGVSSFNGRNGAVVPQEGDYTAEQVGAVSLSGGTMTGNLILNGDPTNNLQAATKQYVDVLGDTVNDILDGTEALPYLHDDYTPPIATSSSVGTVKPGTGLEVSGDGTLSVTTSPTSGITQEQADLRYLQLSGGVMTGNITMTNGVISGLANPTNNNDASNKQYVDSAVSGVQANITTVSGTVDDILDGTEALPYLDEASGDGRYLKLTGGTLSGVLNTGNNKITMGATPTATTDVTNKGYVDNVVKVVSDEVDGIIAGTTPISVPIATDAKVGGVKIGAGLSVDGEGTLSIAQTYLSTQGGTMSADAVINGTDSLEISVGDASQSAVVGVTQSGVTIEHNTNSDTDSSIRAIDNAIEIKANNTTVTVNGTGVALGGAAISGINSLAGQPSTEIAIESDVDMNSHNLTNVGEISTANGLNIKTESSFTAFRNSNGILLSGENSGDSAGMIISPENDTIGIQVSTDDVVAIIAAGKATADGDMPAVIIGNKWDHSSFEPSGGGMTIAGNSTINFTSPQPINFNNNRLTGVANPTAGSDAVNLTYFQSNLPAAPENATTSTAGLVRQINYMSKVSSQATLADVIDALNELWGELQRAGIMVSPI